MVLLADHPDGLSGDQLAVEVYSGDGNISTVRAETTRLRTRSVTTSAVAAVPPAGRPRVRLAAGLPADRHRPAQRGMSERQAGLLPGSSPLLPLVQAEVHRLNHELGL